MDHKVSKDMISSGMIPSGEKTQADLGKTQYGSAPSPSKLMDAYKSMYGNKEEVINEMAGKGMGMTPAPKPGGITPKETGVALRKQGAAERAADRPKPVEKDSSSPAPKTDSRMDQVKKQGFAKSYRKIGPKSETEDMLDKVKDRQVEKAVNRDKDVRRARASYIMSKYGESVDLLAAYHSIYEHHQKDKDGNTIPHEDEELNEGKIPAGLQAYLDKKKGKKEDKKDVKEYIERVAGQPPRNEMGKLMRGQELKDFYAVKKAAKERKPFEPVKSKRKPFEPVAEENQDLNEVGPLAALGALGAKLGIGAKAGAVAAKTGAVAAKTGTAAAKVGSGAAKVTKSGGAIVQGGGPTSLMGKAKKFVKDNPLTSYSIARDMTSGGGGSASGQTRTSSISASADLFDIVKGQLLDEGLTEEEIRDIMLTLTPDEILNEISGELAMKASKAADMKRSELARSGDRTGAANKAAQASRLYKKGAERNIAKQDLSKPLNPQRTDYPMGKGANYQQKPGM